MRLTRMAVLVAVATVLFQPAPASARQGDLTLLPFSPSQAPPATAPPAGHIAGLRGRWDYSDVVCTGTAGAPAPSGTIESIDGKDRDQLASTVAIETCFKGQVPVEKITVLGDSLIAQRDVHGGLGYSGPRIGFLSRGRNLLFLRHTEDPTVWRATTPIYATCIPLADAAPAYALDGSFAAVRHALVVEFESAIEQGHLDLDNSAYLDYIWEAGTDNRIPELKSFMERSSWTTRQDIAVWMLNRGYPDGVADVIALLEDNAAESWKRANAARALRNKPSAEAERALQRAVALPAPQEVVQAATESLAWLNRHDREGLLLKGPEGPKDLSPARERWGTRYIGCPAPAGRKNRVQRILRACGAGGPCASFTPALGLGLRSIGPPALWATAR